DDTYSEDSNNYESTDDYESTYKKSKPETPVIDLIEQILYSPFDDCKVIATQTTIYRRYLITENLRVGEIRYSTLPIENPPTSEQGIAIIITFINIKIQNISHSKVNMDTDLYQEENATLDNQKSKEMQTYTKGIHKHPLPPPSKVPIKIINKLKAIIEETSEELVDITSRKLVSSNFIKATFGINYLSQVHASLNDSDN
ncbi:20241_t:CDS:2, partial [Gigaspora rosea]